MLHLPRTQQDESISRIARRSQAWRGAAALLVLALSATAADVAEPHHVTAVRFWSLGGVTRIAIETDGDFQVKTDHLDNPDRIFFDLGGTKPALTHKAMTVIPVSDHFVKQIRVAEPQHNVTRVVLDLESAVETSTSRLDNPSRLMIELRAPGGKAAEPSKVSEPAKPLETKKTPETTKAPVKTPPSLVVEPAPSQKPVERRQFTPPPPKTIPPPTPPVQAQETAVDPPPELMAKTSVPPAPAPVVLNYKPGPAPPRTPPTAVLAKVTAAPGVTNVSPNSANSAPPSGENALPAKRNASGGRSMIRVLGLKVSRVVLDPGHGGHDTGTIGPEGLREKDLVLDVAQRLGRLIEDRMGSEVIYTRSDDTFVPLERRTEIANEAKADLFLSIHANSSTLRAAAGVETFYLNLTPSKTALELAARRTRAPR